MTRYTLPVSKFVRDLEAGWAKQQAREEKVREVRKEKARVGAFNRAADFVYPSWRYK